MYEYRAEVVYVVDGDTVDAVIDLGFKVNIKVRLRIKDIDTPETHRPSTEEERQHGKEASQKAISLLRNRKVIVKTELKKGKWGRYIASIVLEDGRDYATVMKEGGFVKKESYSNG